MAVMRAGPSVCRRFNCRCICHGDACIAFPLLPQLPL
jgi:hypothetical protein